MNTIELYRSYAETKEIIKEYPNVHDAFKNVESLFEDKETSAELNIIVYGVYNAGKSSLINALLGSEVAPIGDVPLTDKVTTYQWNNLSIKDTPGVDAPLEHEKITKAEMLLADAVIFVVNPTGAADEEKTLSKLIDLICEKKKVFLVFNEKNTLTQDDFIHLKNDTRKRFQSLALDKGVSGILADIPILKVNANRALKGKLTEQKNLVELSGIIELENSLESFFDLIDQDDVNNRLSHSLEVFLNQFLAQLSSTDSNEMVSKYKELLRKLAANQSQCRDNINREITRNRKHIITKCKSAIYQNTGTCQEEIEQFYYESGKAVATVMDDELKYLMSQFNDGVEILSEAIIEQKNGPNINSIPQFLASDPTMSEYKKGLDTESLSKAANTFATLAKPEHIVGGLKLVKDWAPSVMKGIGPKAMERIAGLVVSKWIPYVGTAITGISSIYDLFSEDSGDKQMREQMEKAQQERERFERQVEDTANDMGEQFELSMNQIVRQVLDTVLQQMMEKVESALSDANEQEKADRTATMRAQTLLSTIE